MLIMSLAVILIGNKYFPENKQSSFFVAGVILLATATFMLTDGVEVRAGQNETIINNTVVVNYTYNALETIPLIGSFSVVFFVGLILLTSAYYVKKEKHKDDQQEYYK